MNDHRKLLVLGLNDLLAKNLISLDGDKEDGGHIFTEIANRPSVVLWKSINCQELRLSVWWKYDHSLHPQANLSGNSREVFETSTPLAKRHKYSTFVGAVVSGWLERETAKHLQGEGRRGLFDLYLRTSDRHELSAIPNPTCNGFSAEGRFFA